MQDIAEIATISAGITILALCIVWYINDRDWR
jgi:hypothetical protein